MDSDLFSGGDLAPQLLLAILSKAPIGFALVADDGLILFANDEACRIWGRPRCEVLQLRWQDFTHTDDIEADGQLVHEVLIGAIGHYDLPKRYIRPDGSIQWALLSVFATGDNRYPLASMIQSADQAQFRQQLADNVPGRKTRKLSATIKDLMEACANARKI